MSETPEIHHHPLSVSYVGKFTSNLNSKLLLKATTKETSSSRLWDYNSSSLFDSSAQISRLHIVTKHQPIVPYKLSLKRLIESLKKFPENQGIIKTLNKNLTSIPNAKQLREVYKEDTIFDRIYKTSVDDSQPDTKWLDIHSKSLNKAFTDLPKELKEENKTESRKYLKFKSANQLLDKADINFLKKEFAFTKLKYSRCPQYDSVSGGFAALFAGFIGFLISEKFGIELVDSGDFYIALMYGIFVGFIAHLLTRLIWTGANYNLPISLNHNKYFLYEFFTFVGNKIR